MFERIRDVRPELKARDLDHHIEPELMEDWGDFPGWEGLINDHYISLFLGFLGFLCIVIYLELIKKNGRIYISFYILGFFGISKSLYIIIYHEILINDTSTKGFFWD